MPDYFTHSILAEVIYERLSRETRKKITDKSLYMLGAQGGDVFFMYNLNRASNMGRRLHAIPAAEVFAKLSGANFSYVSGYATHYALDSTMHPTIYAFESTVRTPFAHLAFEKDIGLYASRKYLAPRKIMPSEELYAATSALYDAIKRLEPSLTVTGVERCLKRYFAYTRAVYARKKQKYRFDYDYSSLSPLFDEATELAVRAINCLAEGNADKEVFGKSFLQH